MAPFLTLTDEQRTDAWRQARAGRLTGSCAADMLATIKSGEAAARRDLRMQLVCERLTGKPQDDGFVSKEMQRGTDLEPLAFAAYEASTGQMVRRSGFLAHPTLLVGCSLDGHIGADYRGIVELKCPKSATHLRYLQSRVVPSEYLAQITHNLWISGASWADFVSFDDRFPLSLQLVRIRIERDADVIAAYEQKAAAFLAEVDTETCALRTTYNLRDVLAEAVAP